jgi:hypothetical protein
MIAAPAMVSGSLAAHSLGLIIGDKHTAHRDLAEHGGASGLVPPLVALVGALACVWLLRRPFGRRVPGLGALWFILLPPLAWSLQEGAERLFETESAPFHPAIEPAFLLGLLLQIPFGLLAYAAARVLLAAARTLLGPRTRPPIARWWLSPVAAERRCDLPRLSVLAVGRAGRGPPILAF